MENKREPGGKKQYDYDRAFELCKEKSEKIISFPWFQGIVAKDLKSFCDSMSVKPPSVA